jgi:hypothetical protein
METTTSLRGDRPRPLLSLAKPVASCENARRSAGLRAGSASGRARTLGVAGFWQNEPTGSPAKIGRANPSRLRRNSAERTQRGAGGRSAKRSQCAIPQNEARFGGSARFLSAQPVFPRVRSGPSIGPPKIPIPGADALGVAEGEAGERVSDRRALDRAAAALRRSQPSPSRAMGVKSPAVSPPSDSDSSLREGRRRWIRRSFFCSLRRP